jgi:hypothetical protein
VTVTRLIGIRSCNGKSAVNFGMISWFYVGAASASNVTAGRLSDWVSYLVGYVQFILLCF